MWLYVHGGSGEHKCCKAAVISLHWHLQVVLVKVKQHLWQEQPLELPEKEELTEYMAIGWQTR